MLGFFRVLGKDKTQGLQFICSDMWKAYIKVIAKKAPQALHILDRFHLVSNVDKALDEVRAAQKPRRLIEKAMSHSTVRCAARRSA